MTSPLPSGAIAAARAATVGPCADPIGPGMPGPGAACFTCPPGYAGPHLRADPGMPGSWVCWPASGQSEPGLEPARAPGTRPLRNLLVGAAGFAGGLLAVHFFGGRS